MDSATIRLARTAHRPLLVTVGLMAALALVCLVGLLVDPRTLGGQPVWAKPLKFAVSFILYNATLAVLIGQVTRPGARRWARGAGHVVALTGVIEMLAITGQVVRGRASHFNVETPLDTAVWATMGTSIVVLWLATAAIGATLVREHALAPAAARAVRLGVGVALLGMAVAFLMTSPTPEQRAAAADGGMSTIGAHAVGTPDGGPGLPLLGWSTTGGDLRAAHFVGLHALQALPLLAWGLALLASRVPALRPERVRARLVTVGAAGWAGLTLLLTWQALRGQPLLAPDAATLAAAGALVAAVVLAVALAVRRDAPARPVAPVRPSALTAS